MMTTTTLPIGSYHDVLRTAYADRGGEAPAVSLEEQHDWMLLIFARSDRARRMAMAAADRLAARRPENDPTMELHRSTCEQVLRTLATGTCPLPSIRGYCTPEAVIGALALAAEAL